MTKYFLLCGTFWLGCQRGTPYTDSKSQDTGSNTDSIILEEHDSAENVECHLEVGLNENNHFSAHFQQWLELHPEYSSDLTRLDLNGGSFGGLLSEDDCVEREPVIFIHGNSDRASGGALGGWAQTREQYINAGYRNAELYATTYGPADFTMAEQYRHDADTLIHIRQLIEAVLAYTGAEKVDIVAFSLGVTLARKAILGGAITYSNPLIDLGAPLSNRIDTFIGIAGANQGLTSCYLSTSPTCSGVDGLYPGELFGFSVINQSQIIQDINSQSGYEGDYRFSIWSPDDEMLNYGCIVWGENTAYLPNQTDTQSFAGLSHILLKYQTVSTQLSMLIDHEL